MLSQDRGQMRLALPSKGELEKPTLDFLAACGLKVFRPNTRQYTASIPSAPQISVLFQRASDIFNKVVEGSIDVGITGYDILCEQTEGHDDVVVMHKNLGYGECELVLGVPESWIDISSVAEVADLTVLFKKRGKGFRIATKYPNLTRGWLYEKGVFHFTLVQNQGALEAAPVMGYADVIADITTTGTTLRENKLKRVAGGTILQSQACLIGNKRLLLEDRVKLDMARMILELIEAHLSAKQQVSITANIRGESPEAIYRTLAKERDLAGLRGPTISKVYAKAWGEDDWYAVTIVVKRALLLETIDHLRRAGGTDITVVSPDYVFDSKSWSYQRLVEKLRKARP